MAVTRVALFISCAADLAMPQVVRAARTLIEATGAAVDVPSRQSCCGQVAINSGHPRPGRELAEHWLRTFEGYDAVVSPSGSCVATVHHAYPRLGPDPGWQERVAAVAGHTLELTQFLARHGSELVFRSEQTVVWHQSCHMLRMLHERSSPRAVLDRVEGLTVLDFEEQATCCGFGGTFATKFPEVSEAMADRKLDSAELSGADCIVSADPGCLMHLSGRRSRTGRGGPRPTHVAELLEQALVTGAQGGEG